MAASDNWTTVDMPNLSGKIAVVTGANSGTGYEVTRGLALKQAHVVLACRSLPKGEAVMVQIHQDLPNASLDLLELDLADLESIRCFADVYADRYDSLHLLCNNAGVMALPYRQSADGFEMQFGTNHLGHFALTGLLLHLIKRGGKAARVVTMSSLLHRSGKINFDDLNGQKTYDKRAAYNQSKLANLLFTYELQRKFETDNISAISVAAHPGYSATNLQTAGPAMENAPLTLLLSKLANRLFAQSPEMGALPMLYAATAPDINGGDFIGPNGFMGMRGYPQKERSSDTSYNPEIAQKLWLISEEMTKIKSSF